MMFGSGIVEIERGNLLNHNLLLATDTAIARNSWCYTTTLDYKQHVILQDLIEVVSKNGNLL